MITRYVIMLLLVMMLASIAAVGATVAETEETTAEREARVGTSSVKSCTGGNVSLSADEERMFDLCTTSPARIEGSRVCAYTRGCRRQPAPIPRR